MGERSGSQLLITDSTAHLPPLSADTNSESAQPGAHERWWLPEQRAGWPDVATLSLSQN